MPRGLKDANLPPLAWKAPELQTDGDVCEIFGIIAQRTTTPSPSRALLRRQPTLATAGRRTSQQLRLRKRF